MLLFTQIVSVKNFFFSFSYFLKLLNRYREVEEALFEKASSRIGGIDINSEMFNDFQEIDCYAMNLLAQAYM